MREAQLRQVLARLGVQVVERASSGWLSAPCPFAEYLHARGTDRRPSFGAKVEEGGISSYFCHTCKMHGRISSLARALGHYRHGDTQHYGEVAIAADRADQEDFSYQWHDEIPGRRDEPQEPLVEEAYSNVYLPATTSQEALAYLSSRRLVAGTADFLGLRWDPRQRRVLFPVRGPNGALYGFSGRAVDGVTQPKIRDYPPLKKRQHVLGSEHWRWGHPCPLVLVEGLVAYAWLTQLGLWHHADLGALLGSELTDWKRDLVSLRNTGTYLLLDNDPAGDQCLFGRMDREGNRDLDSGAVNRLKPFVPTYVPMWPEGKDDPDQLTLEEVLYMLSNTPVEV